MRAELPDVPLAQSKLVSQRSHTATARDRVGNRANDTVRIVLDLEPPTLEVRMDQQAGENVVEVSVVDEVGNRARYSETLVYSDGPTTWRWSPRSGTGPAWSSRT